MMSIILLPIFFTEICEFGLVLFSIVVWFVVSFWLVPMLDVVLVKTWLIGQLASIIVYCVTL